MTSVRELSEHAIRMEGGFVNDPDDPGGATNWGVTIHTMRRLGLDIDGDGDVDVDDVKALPRDKAIEIFERHYFYGPKINQLPNVLHATVYDMQINSGSNAVKILQRLFRQMGYECSVDGQLGPQSIGLAFKAVEEIPNLDDAYSVERRNYYFAIGDRRPASRKYCVSRAGGKGGWIRRAEEFMKPKYRMSDAAFKARIASWG